MALTAKTEKDNFSRFGQGIVGTASTMTRDLLASYISPTDLVMKVRPGHPVWSSLDKLQKSLVQNAVMDGFLKFDISLSYKLIRNVCTNLRDPLKVDLPAPSKGWGIDPQPSDVTPSDDLERIRILRNSVYGHVSQSSMPESEYQKHWQLLKDIASRMDTLLGKSYLNELQELELYKLSDAQVKDILKEITDYGKMIDGHDNRLCGHTKRLDDHDRRLDDHDRQIHYHGRQIDETNRRINGHEDTIEKHDRQLDDQGSKIQSQETMFQFHQAEITTMKHQIPTGRSKSKFRFLRRIFNRESHHWNEKEFRHKLCEINELETKVIPVAPLQETSKMPIELLYASVIVKEDFKYFTGEKEKKSEGQKVVKKPDDMFKIGKKFAKCIYLLGDAAHGKTTYCLWLIKQWCLAQKRSISFLRKNIWEDALKEYDFAFYVPLRHVNTSRVFLVDMICMDILKQYQSLSETVRLALGDRKCRCIIFIDGLDEWKPPPFVVNQLTCKALPNFDHISNSVFFITMRPWVFPALAGLVRGDDRVLEIQGLDDDGIKSVTKNVLVNHFGMDPKSQELVQKNDEIMQKLENETMKSFIQIPLLAVVCVQIWHIGKHVGESMTSFYAAMIDMLIERAHDKHKLGLDYGKLEDNEIPNIFSDNENVKERFSILLKLGKVAYEGLISTDKSLVFQRRKLENEIGARELQFALDVGLISQKEESSIVTKNVSVHFFHKSVQEILAGIFIVSIKEVGESFLKTLSNVEVIMEFSNVIMFVCGMCPSLGSVISQHVVNVSDNDEGIFHYRNAFGYNVSVIELYKMQVNWFKEIQYGQIIAKEQVPFHVSDIYLDSDSDRETVRVTKELLSNHFGSIRSLSAQSIPRDGIQSITDTELNSFLAKAGNLKSFHKLSIDGHLAKRPLIAFQLPAVRILDIHDVWITKSEDVDNVSPFLTGMSDLREVRLLKVQLGSEGLAMLDGLKLIETVLLESVDLPEVEWEKFICSVKNIQHKCYVNIDKTNIDEKSLAIIRSSPTFEIDQDRMTKEGWSIAFHTGKRVTES